MSITSAEGAAFAGGLGVERVVVGRELSVREIAKVRTHAWDMPGHLSACTIQCTWLSVVPFGLR